MNQFCEFIGYFILCLGLFVFGIYIGNNATPKERTMTSYEYTTDCRCGGTIEGYQSLVDGFRREECKSCGYHAEFNK